MKSNTFWSTVAASAALLGVVGYIGFASYVAHAAVQATLYTRIPDAEAAIAKDPDNALAHHRLGEALAGHDSSRAIAEFRAAVRLQPDDREAAFELAYELGYAGKKDEAKAIYRQLATTNDDWGRAAKRNLGRFAASEKTT